MTLFIGLALPAALGLAAVKAWLGGAETSVGNQVFTTRTEDLPRQARDKHREITVESKQAHVSFFLRRTDWY
jgi:hypothetical protein